MRDLLRLVSKRFAERENTTYHGTTLRQITPIQKFHKQIIHENDRILLLFLQMYSMKQFLGTFLKYLTKHEDDQLFWIVYESSDRGKVTETSMPLKKNWWRAHFVHCRKIYFQRKSALPLPFYILPGLTQDSIGHIESW